jgi:hypothetical protein
VSGDLTGRIEALPDADAIAALPDADAIAALPDADAIAALPDADAIAALAFVLDVEDASAQGMDELKAEEDRLAEAFEYTPELGEIVSPEKSATRGDLARTALAYLAGQEAASELVGKAVNRPRAEGKRDPLTFALGGLVLLALKSDVELKRSPAGKWSFHFRLKPTKDSALAGILTKMWGLFGDGQG